MYRLQNFLLFLYSILLSIVTYHIVLISFTISSLSLLIDESILESSLSLTSFNRERACFLNTTMLATPVAESTSIFVSNLVVSDSTNCLRVS